jgi:hypothetical protein
MVAYTADYYCMSPEWGVIELEADDVQDFTYAAELEVASIHEGAKDIEIRDIKEVI